MAALKRARQQYVQRCEDLEKAKAMTAKGVDEASGSKTIDKRRKSQDDAQSKASSGSESILNILRCKSQQRLQHKHMCPAQWAALATVPGAQLRFRCLA